ncbi:efflux RND transporter periplasmic adaptor subunit [Tamlana sp. 2201CG12-4]|uniref:efflux RND transporter periplasmic adaptor subunit n=1 Tax=Tamlana sp. 2201CG12-4 TaxID=3112582 RepID=UPI002DB5E715|nr:efflux RND transporter periplasmic adaptor subunit [Tamlana sp. 2201CG12-4]MEC3908195.1 efflux RND transporter periplasmic adaptor subunit [Tamlana sp. 2201CG12-4]
MNIRVLTHYRIILVFCLFFLLGYSCKKEIETPPVVIVEKPTMEDVEIYGEYVGQLTAKKTVEIRARVDGFLEQMLFKEGKFVNEGDILFTIDPAQYIARTNKMKAQVEQAKVAAAKAERDIARLRPLYEQNAASQLDLDNAQASLEKEQANILMYEAELEQAQLELSFTKVRSPISGFVSERQVDIGTLVGSGGVSLLTSVFQTDTVFVHFHMTALDYLKSKGNNVDLTEDKTEKGVFKPTVGITRADRSDYPIRGLVDFANPQVDSKTGTFTLRAAIPNPKKELLPGQFTRVKVLLNVLENAVIIPSKSIIIEKGGEFVFVMRNDKTVEKRFIQTAEELTTRVVVSRGLYSNEQIITEGQHKLQAGIKVIPTTLGDSIWTKKDQLKE